MKREVTIIGAGLVGSLLGIYLAKRGYPVVIYERRGDMRKENMAAGRSINLALSDRGIQALEEVGIMNEICPITIPMHGRQIHHEDGSSAYQPYGLEGQFINSVSRGELNIKLMNLAESYGVEIFFNHTCDFINWDKKTIQFKNAETTVIKNFDLLFGSDGAYSAARLNHQLQHDRFQYHQYYIDYGYKELHIPPGNQGAFRMKENALHIWPRGNYMLIALPNTDGSFTCTLFFPFEGNPSFASLQTKQEINDFFNQHFPDAAQLMPTLLEDFINNPTSSLVTVKCFPWVRKNNFTLIGDAAHALVPFFGQGMNCGFEDCSVLNKLADEEKEDWEKILERFQALRKPDADAIADLALNNFIEMRDKVADPVFLLQKKIENRFSSKYPRLWTPAYGLVTFRPDIRYSTALEKGNRQQASMDEIMRLPGIEDIWDSPRVEEAILQKINNAHV